MTAVPPGTTWFESDNCASVHPKVIEALLRANHGHAPSYGYDRHTAELDERVAEIFGPDACAYPVFNGTAANVVALQQLSTRWGGVVCASWSHINTNEGGAPEKVGGVKLLTTPGREGKLAAGDVDSHARDRGDEHRTQPEVFSFAQTSELGRVYSVTEAQALTDRAHEQGMRVHVDGARLANAAVAAGVGLADLSSGIGVDVLSMGGTKNGLMFGELIVDLTGAMGDQMLYLRKQNMQLTSKMRFISAQFLALFTDDLWRECAANANRQAAWISQELSQVDGVQIVIPTDSNAVWARLPRPALERVGEEFGPHADLDREDSGVARIMCSFDTTRDDAEKLVAGIRRLLG